MLQLQPTPRDRSPVQELPSWAEPRAAGEEAGPALATPRKGPPSEVCSRPDPPPGCPGVQPPGKVPIGSPIAEALLALAGAAIGAYLLAREGGESSLRSHFRSKFSDPLSTR